MALVQSEDGSECFVDTPLLLGTHPAHQFTEPSGVYRADLLHEDAGARAKHLDLGTEGCWPGTAGCRRDQHDRPGQQLVGLNDHSVPTATLLVAGSSGRTELVDVTPQHACSP